MTILHEIFTTLLSFLIRVHLIRVKDGFHITIRRDSDGYALIVQHMDDKLVYDVSDHHDAEYLLEFLPTIGVDLRQHRKAKALLEKACGVSHK